MYVVFLKFSKNKTKAGEFMQAHNDWLAENFASGVFVLAGTIMPPQGGAIFTKDIPREKLSQILEQDPFVAENIVSPEIYEISPNKKIPELEPVF